jgi:glycine/D-amino acid oxidase-like deaminating enzyme
MKKLDVIIVGGGLAGTVLAWHLRELDQSFLIFDNPERPSSSRVAGGLFNPVTGKYLAKTWLVEELFEYLAPFYNNIENQTGSSFFHKIGLHRPFSGPAHKESALAQLDKHDLKDWVSVENKDLGKAFASEGEGLFSENAGYLDLPVFLDASKAFFMNQIREEEFQIKELLWDEAGVQYKDVSASKIIFCDGWAGTGNTYFSWLPFNPVKGETLVGKVQDYEANFIVNQGKWIIPLGEGRARLGATYSWHELDFLPSEKARLDLLEAGSKILQVPFQVEEQHAGVRPATKDRRPFVGFHPVHKNLGIFNGLGAKGVSLAPYFGRQLARKIVYGEVIQPEANIERFYTLYS